MGLDSTRLSFSTSEGVPSVLCHRACIRMFCLLNCRGKEDLNTQVTGLTFRLDVKLYDLEGFDVRYIIVNYSESTLQAN